MPNLFTAPGDALGGLFLMGLLLGQSPQVSVIALVAAASVSAYAFGILLNDLCDLREDRRLRPERPLPAKDISLPSAWLAALVAAAASLACAHLLHADRAGAILLLTILAYDAVLKRLRYLGSLSMGCCRGANVWLGAACLHPSHDLTLVLLIPAVAVTLTITVITLLADRENTTQTPGKTVFLPSLIFLLGWLLILPFLPFPQVLTTGAFSVSFLLMAWSVGQNAMTGLFIYDRQIPPHVMQPAIGQYLRTLVPWQTSWIVLPGSVSAWCTAALVLIGFLLSRYLAKRFPQS